MQNKINNALKNCFLVIFTMATFVGGALAEDKEDDGEQVVPVTGYYEIKNAITTNLSSTGTKLNYISVNVTLSVGDSRDIELLKLHEPLIKDKITEILGAETFEQVSADNSRNEIQKKVKDAIFKLTDECVGRRILKDVMFLDFKWQ